MSIGAAFTSEQLAVVNEAVRDALINAIIEPTRARLLADTALSRLKLCRSATPVDDELIQRAGDFLAREYVWRSRVECPGCYRHVPRDSIDAHASRCLELHDLVREGR